MQHPEESYDVPEQILDDPDLDREQKIARLRRWRYEQRQLAVSVDEGMDGPEPEFLGRIDRILEELTDEPDPLREPEGDELRDD